MRLKLWGGGGRLSEGMMDEPIRYGVITLSDFLAVGEQYVVGDFGEKHFIHLDTHDGEGVHQLRLSHDDARRAAMAILCTLAVAGDAHAKAMVDVLDQHFPRLPS